MTLSLTVNRWSSIARLLLLSSSFCAAAQQPAQVIVEHNAEMKTRDGITLRADIYRPSGGGSFPVLLERTPYDKTRLADFAYRAVARNYIFVAQDVRGRFTSDGEWYPFKHESEDGFDSVEWAASLPGSSGKVGMVGGSYIGATQMLAAVAHPPHLAGICPVVTASNYHDNWVYQGGAFEQWFSESWTALLAQDSWERLAKRATDALGETTKPTLDAFSVFHLTSSPGPGEMTKRLAPYFLDWLDHPAYDSYWKQWSIEERYPDIRVPALTVAAWYDVFLGGSLRNYIGMKSASGSAAARKGQRLFVTIGGHAGSGRTIGAVDFGPAAAQYDETALILDWYDFLLRGKENRFAHDKPVTLFVMGQNQWRSEDSWPVARATQTRYYLHSSGGANSASGDGALSSAPPEEEKPDTFLYDPNHPVPTVGGPLCCDPRHVPAGPQDQRQTENRKDVLVYSTPPLASDIEVTGPITMHLFAASTATDTDFTAKLVDVGLDGFARNLTDGIIRARYRKSREIPSFLQRNEIYSFTIDLWATSNVFLRGHRIRVEIASSNFPRFDRNLNTPETNAHSSAGVTASNTIFHDAMHASYLLLPVIPPQQKPVQ